MLHSRGLVHRGTYPVNWCCHLGSAISDIEVDHLALEKKTKIRLPGYDKPVEFGVIYDVAYKCAGEKDRKISQNLFQISNFGAEKICARIPTSENPVLYFIYSICSQNRLSFELYSLINRF